MAEMAATPQRARPRRRAVILGAALATSVAVGGTAAAVSLHSSGSRAVLAPLTCDASWSCLAPASARIGHALLAPVGAMPVADAAAVVTHDDGAQQVDLVFSPSDPASTFTGKPSATLLESSDRDAVPALRGQPTRVRGVQGLLQTGPGFGAVEWSADGWTYKLAVAAGKAAPRPAEFGRLALKLANSLQSR